MPTSYVAIDNPVVPVAAAGTRFQLLRAAGTTFPSAALPAGGDWVASAVIACAPLRRVTIEVIYNANAATAASYCEIIPMLCQEETAPLVSDAVWFVPGVTDGSIVAAAIAAGALAAGTDFTQSQAWGRAVYLPLVIQAGGAIAASNKIRVKFDVDVTGCRYFALQAREAGDPVNTGTLDLYICGGV